jgi:hypothetical protein
MRKPETSVVEPSWHLTSVSIPEEDMVDDGPLRAAVNTAWSVYRARHREVDAADSRRCLLERHLQRRREARESDAEELTDFGIAYLELLSDDEC